MAEAFAGAGDELVDRLVRLEGGPALGVAPCVPRPQPVEPHVRSPLFEQPLDRGLDRPLDRLMEAEGVVGRVVEAILLEVRVVAKVLEPGVLRHLLAKVVHAVEEACQRVALLDEWLEHRAKRALPNAPVVVLEEWKHLLRSLFDAVPVDGHRADHLPPAGAKPGELAAEPDLRLPDSLPLLADPPHRAFHPPPTAP